eukprot:766816-Hanusia_phi.AAC.2
MICHDKENFHPQCQNRALTFDVSQNPTPYKHTEICQPVPPVASDKGARIASTCPGGRIAASDYSSSFVIGGYRILVAGRKSLSPGRTDVLSVSSEAVVSPASPAEIQSMTTNSNSHRIDFSQRKAEQISFLETPSYKKESFSSEIATDSSSSADHLSLSPFISKIQAESNFLLRRVFFNWWKQEVSLSLIDPPKYIQVVLRQARKLVLKFAFDSWKQKVEELKPLRVLCDTQSSIECLTNNEFSTQKQNHEGDLSCLIFPSLIQMHYAGVHDSKVVCMREELEIKII